MIYAFNNFYIPNFIQQRKMLHLTQVIQLSAVLFVFVEGDIIPGNLIISLPDGKIQGTTYTTGKGNTYYGFQGIPFATPPVKELRFEPPQPSKTWDGVLNTTKDAKTCITANYFSNPEAESEDCLYINVYVPDVKSLEKLPVMVFVYGGAFVGGNCKKTANGPDFLIEHDVIVVMFNYRMNVFGFISIEDSNLPGNLGLKDQTFALKWVQKNIGYFGGDADKVTLFGHSSGATSIALHLLSKQSKGLFRAAILESGSALQYWALARKPKQNAFEIAESIPGANFGNDSNRLKEFLKNCTVADIMNAYLAVTRGQLSMLPTIEPDSGDAFISKPFYGLIASGDFNQVPILIGMCAFESVFSLPNLNVAQQVAEDLDNNPEKIVPLGLHPNFSDILTVSQRIKNIYIKADEQFADNLASLAEYKSDNDFTRAIIKQAELSSKYMPVYLYEFWYYGRPTYKPYIPGLEKAGHGAELPFILNISGFSSTIESDVLTQNRVTTLWTNFAKYLNPTPLQTELFQNLTWPTITPDNLQYLSINGTLKLRPHIKNKSYGKWNDIFETYGAKPFYTF